jgi:hypothetical protein
MKMTNVTIHLGSRTPHYYDIVSKHRSAEAATAYAAKQNAATYRRYPTAYQTYEAVTIVYRGGQPDIASDGFHRRAR